MCEKWRTLYFPFDIGSSVTTLNFIIERLQFMVLRDFIDKKENRASHSPGVKS